MLYSNKGMQIAVVDEKITTTLNVAGSLGERCMIPCGVSEL